jgi:hypothetical protein
MNNNQIDILTSYYGNYENRNFYYIFKKTNIYGEIDSINKYFTPNNFNDNLIIYNQDQFMRDQNVNNILNEAAQMIKIDNIDRHFCGKDGDNDSAMDRSYLFTSIKNIKYYALLKIQIDQNNHHFLHSAITFMFQVNSTTHQIDSLYIDALCVNYKTNSFGGSILINRMFDLCRVQGINIITLLAVNTPNTINFYSKMGFQERTDVPDKKLFGVTEMINNVVEKKFNARQQKEEAELIQLVNMLTDAFNQEENPEIDNDNSFIKQSRSNSYDSSDDKNNNYKTNRGGTRRYRKKRHRSNKRRKTNRRCKTNKR